MSALPDHSEPHRYDPLGTQWVVAFQNVYGRPASDVDRQDQLFSLMFAGRGHDGAWQAEDWAEYRRTRKALWAGDRMWPAGDISHGYGRFENHLERLATYYGSDRDGATRFTRAAGLVWGGIAYEGPALEALFRASVGRHLSQLHEGAAGWRDEHVDDSNPVHHWVAGFVAGYFYGAAVGALANSIRDGAQMVTGLGGTMADIRLGNVAAGQGAMLRRTTRRSGKGEAPYAGLIDRMRQDLSPYR